MGWGVGESRVNSPLKPASKTRLFPHDGYVKDGFERNVSQGGVAYAGFCPRAMLDECRKLHPADPGCLGIYNTPPPAGHTPLDIYTVSQLLGATMPGPIWKPGYNLPTPMSTCEPQVLSKDQVLYLP